MNSLENNAPASQEFPQAVVRRLQPARPSRVWWFVLLSLCLSVGLFLWSRRNSGDLIEIEFRESHGLKVDDALRYRGTEIGRVERLQLGPHADTVLVSVRLIPNARTVITEGSVFWIARPVVSLESIRGVDTIVGPKYIAVDPGKNKGAVKNRFRGSEHPPSLTPPEGAIEIVLDAPTRHGLVAGAPILHRGFRIGDVLQVGLANDARSVSIRCAIDPQFRELVRSNSKFWIRSGWRMDIGLTGIKLDADSISQIINGGVEFATPDVNGEVAITGQRFNLYERADPAWLDWKPSIPYGEVLGQVQAMSTQPYRMALRWQERSFGFKRDKQKLGWCILLSDGSVVARSDLLEAPKSALTDSSRLEVAGVTLRLPGSGPDSNTRSMKLNGGSFELIRFLPKEQLPLDTHRSSESILAMRPPGGPLDVVVLGPEPASCVTLDAARIQISPNGWDVDADVPLPADLDGSPVAAIESGQVIGVLSLEPKKHRILLIQRGE